MLQPRLLKPSGMAVSIATHLTVLTIGLGYAGVRPFETAPVEAIAVDLVTPDEVKEAVQETPPKPTPPLEIPDLSTKDQPAAAATPAPPQQSPPQDPRSRRLQRHAQIHTPKRNRPPSSRRQRQRLRRRRHRNPHRPGARRNPISASSIRSIWVCLPWRQRLRHSGVLRRQGVDRRRRQDSGNS